MYKFSGNVDKSMPIPLYYQLKQIILEDIKSGKLKPGDMLPPEMDLLKVYDISITTVRHAMKELVMEGYVYRIKSKGTFVATPKIPQLTLAKLGSFRDEMAQQGFTPSIKELIREIIPCSSEVAEKLNIPENHKVYHSTTIRYADDIPILIEEIFVRADWINFEEFDIKKDKMYKQLSKFEKTRMQRSERIIESRLATEREHRYLKVPKGFPIQDITLLDLNRDFEPYLYGILSYRGDRNKFNVVLIAE